MGKTLRFYHLILGGFLLPMALVFFITGALYAVDYKGEKKTVSWSYQAKGGYTLATDELSRSVASQLAIKDFSLKLSGIPKTRIISNGDKTLSWKMKSSRVSASVNESLPDTISVRVKQTTLSRSFLNLHKVEHGLAFTIYVFIASIALIVLTITGFLMLLRDKLHRQVGMWSTLAGILLFVVLISF